MRIKTILLAACAAALIAPAASQAATLGMEGDTLVYRGEGARASACCCPTTRTGTPARRSCASPTTAPTAC